MVRSQPYAWQDSRWAASTLGGSFRGHDVWRFAFTDKPKQSSHDGMHRPILVRYCTLHSFS